MDDRQQAFAAQSSGRTEQEELVSRQPGTPISDTRPPQLHIDAFGRAVWTGTPTETQIEQGRRIAADIMKRQRAMQKEADHARMPAGEIHRRPVFQDQRQVPVPPKPQENRVGAFIEASRGRTVNMESRLQNKELPELTDYIFEVTIDPDDDTKLKIGSGWVWGGNHAEYFWDTTEEASITPGASDTCVWLTMKVHPRYGYFSANHLPVASTDDDTSLTDNRTWGEVRRLLAQFEMKNGKPTNIYQRWRGGDIYFAVYCEEGTNGTSDFYATDMMAIYQAGWNIVTDGGGNAIGGFTLGRQDPDLPLLPEEINEKP